jgi:ArsR family transcriptional regulator
LNKVFDALASDARRKILSLLSRDEMSAGEIAARFEMSKPAISKHLQILENAGLVTSEKRGQFVWYAIERHELSAVLLHFLQSVAPESPVAAKPPRGGTAPPAERRSATRLDRPGDRA